MVLSNLNNNMDVESRTMATMGDTLGGSVWTAAVRAARRRRCAVSGGRAGPRSSGGTAASCSPSGRGRALTEAWPLCLLSLERPPGRCALLLPHGRSGVRGLHKESHETRLNRSEPQVRDRTTAHPLPAQNVLVWPDPSWGHEAPGGPAQSRALLSSPVCHSQSLPPTKPSRGQRPMSTRSRWARSPAPCPTSR